MINPISKEIFQLHFKEFGSCVYVLKLEGGAFLIDTTTKENRKELLEDLKELGFETLDIKGILLTHTHYDHVGNNSIFPNAKVLSKREIEEPGIKVLGTPGHTSDSVCFLYTKILFSGDTLFHQGIGRTDLPTGSEEQMKKSLEFLRNLDYEVLCPGHVD